MKSVKLGLLVGIAVFSGCKDGNTESINEQKVSLGETLYSDTSLSANGTMSCATCHELSDALIDPRVTSMTLGGSLGDDGVSIGDRNAPTAGYASFSPVFHHDDVEGLYIGGQFLDGRAKDLKVQAKGPFLSAVEMGMSSVSEVIARIRENTSYIGRFKKIYGDDIFENENSAFDAIASFESSQTFA
ncbi:MAG: cytochrome-c peroxidase [Sulfurimonas sp.]|nr:cytochrome-c peroxidase [Sulfurimonas sp.]